MGIYKLEKMFNPDGIAVIGASEKKGSIGRALMENLQRAQYPNTVYPVNPGHDRISGRKAYASVSDLPESPDLAVIAVPIDSVPDIISECVDKEVDGAIVISAGGREAGEKGRNLEDKIAAIAREGGLRILGPNCMGIICPDHHLNASFAAHHPTTGSLAFISQSGAICSGMLDRALQENMGFRYFVSIGSMLDVDFGDLIDYVGNDPEVSSILLYIESLSNVRKFMSAVRAVSRIKPVIVLKSGRSAAGAAAAASHTGAMASEDRIYEAAFHRAGAVRLETLDDFFGCAELLAKQSAPQGNRLMVVTNSGGPGVMAVDAIVAAGLQPSDLTEKSRNALDDILPSHWSRGNPIDILGDATAQRYRKTIEALQNDDLDGLLVILNPQAMTAPDQVAEALTEAVKGKPWPVFASWMGGRDVQAGVDILNRAGIATYDTPEQAIRTFKYLHDYSQNLKLMQQIPPRLSRHLDFDKEKARELVTEGLSRENGLLTEAEAKAVVQAYGLPVNSTVTVSDIQTLEEMMERFEFPLAMKICSPDIIHKSDAHGVRLDIESPEEARRAFEQMLDAARAHDAEARIEGVTLQPMVSRPDAELLIGANRDRLFGPVVMFGLGGIHTEIIEDINLALVPLNRHLAHHLMEQSKVYPLLTGYRHQPEADMQQLEEMLLRVSQLMIDFPEIVELDLNPVMLRQGRPLVVDARLVVKPSALSSPRHLAISPYPAEDEERIRTDGLELLVRPIKPEDAPLLEQLFDTLSPSSIYHRFFRPMNTLPHSTLVRFTQIDYDREIALVAMDQSEQRMLGVARVTVGADPRDAEFGVLVGDPWQGKGLGERLLSRCLRIARRRDVKTVWGTVLAENTKMLNLGRSLGFEVVKGSDPPESEMRIDLSLADIH